MSGVQVEAMRKAERSEIPAKARTLLDNLGRGWRCTGATYAVGPVERGTIDRDLRKRVTVVDVLPSCAVRFRHDRLALRAVGIWIDGKWSIGQFVALDPATLADPIPKAERVKVLDTYGELAELVRDEAPAVLAVAS